MRFKAPIITLGAGLVAAGVLYALNVNLSNDVARDKTAATPTAAATTARPPAASSAPPPAASSAPAAVGDGSGNAAQRGTVTYAGAVDGGAASLGIVVNNGKAIAYVCDGKAAEAWMDGNMANGQATLQGAKGGALTATYTNGQVKGTVAIGAKSWTFTLKAVSPPSGLYRSQASLRKKLDASWVVLPDGNQIGVQTEDGTARPAPNFDLSTKTVVVDGTPVAIESSTPATGY
ncbi:hypothetical protein [Dactylosporangium sp. CA-092794]|uniref:hypothetical protein n=1 Tax=Dactylosporangium sp. CA-092794 TaxID=3239929 RepID=UPI003D93849F